MADMLVRLYDLPELSSAVDAVKEKGILIKQAIAPEKSAVILWVEREFGRIWAGECEASFARQPVSCFLAVRGGKIAGFACYDATMKGFFGPTGVSEENRGLGIGKALLLSAMHALKSQGYAYGIIGGVGPAEFYRKSLDAIDIPKSSPGIYGDMVKPADQ